MPAASLTYGINTAISLTGCPTHSWRRKKKRNRKIYYFGLGGDRELGSDRALSLGGKRNKRGGMALVAANLEVAVCLVGGRENVPDLLTATLLNSWL